MTTEIIIPHFGANIDKAKICEWLVSEGDTVEMGDPIVVVETVKTTLEIEAEDDGVIINIIHQTGTHKVGTVIGTLTLEC